MGLGLGKLFGNAGGAAADKVIGSIGGAVDGLITSDEEKLQLKNKLTEIVIGGLGGVIDAQKEVLLKEMSGTKLQRNWRPISALSFVFIVVSTYFIFPIINLWAESESLAVLIADLKGNDGFWNLMQLMIGGYAISRGIEKVSDTVTKNVDMSFLKKKDRKE